MLYRGRNLRLAQYAMPGTSLTLHVYALCVELLGMIDNVSIVVSFVVVGTYIQATRIGVQLP